MFAIELNDPTLKMGTDLFSENGKWGQIYFPSRSGERTGLSTENRSDGK